MMKILTTIIAAEDGDIKAIGESPHPIDDSVFDQLIHSQVGTFVTLAWISHRALQNDLRT
ncbi:MAG: hypothetical protein Q8O25_17550 [Sulfurisoma sp.]|nr:hypothetical protein [Sulfurisoma sp.]